MKRSFFGIQRSLSLFAVVLLSLACSLPAFPQGSAVHSVHGQGIATQGTGLPDGGQQMDHLSITAWQDASGKAFGTVTWELDYQQLPGGGGPLNSGYPWLIQVDILTLLAGNRAYLEGVVIHSGQNPADEGRRVGFFVTDNGNGPTDPADELTVRLFFDDGSFGDTIAGPIISGNFTLQ